MTEKTTIFSKLRLRTTFNAHNYVFYLVNYANIQIVSIFVIVRQLTDISDESVSLLSLKGYLGF